MGLLKQGIIAGSNRSGIYKPFILPGLLIVCTIFYYFGELVEWAAWDALRASFFYGVHDVHRLLFLVPITYAGYNARIKGAVIVTLVSLIIFLPRAFFISPYPDAFLRMFIFTVFAGTLGGLTGMVHNHMERSQLLETKMADQRNRMLQIIDNMADGIVVTGQDYRIRLMNSRMAKHFGEGTGLTCYEHLHKIQEPCRDCKIEYIINSNEICRWQCQFPDSRVCDIIAAPYVDIDGTACQIAIFRDIIPRTTT
ncbi:MAG: hypothetical protein A2144_06955 [Chloroflexi bacterium RBG_16_50_9]|nr:MAG: hypothetical protein A2144_06955 [Chloroflexi bacterium RBG_16_50_9]